MLKHEDNLDTPPVPAAQTRVKAEELARAIARIEARRQEEARRLEGTMLIGDAIKDLQLDATPDEILAEVESLHEERTEETHVTVRDAPSNTVPIWILIGSIVSSLALGFWWGTAATRTTPDPVRTTAASPPMMIPATPSSSSSAMLSPPEYRAQPSQPIVALPDRVPFGCSRYTLQEILITGSVEGIKVYDFEQASWYDNQHAFKEYSVASQPMFGLRGLDWTLIKYGGRVYVRGWVLRPVSATGSTRLYDTPEAPELAGRATPVTLPIQGLHFDGMYSRVQDRPFMVARYAPQVGGPPFPVPQPLPQLEVRATHVHLDEHTYEKWQP